MADYLCNAAMDQRHSAEMCNDAGLQQAAAARRHLHLYLDGGFRPGVAGSTGWVLYSVHLCGEELLWTVLAWRTQFLDDATIKSSFLCEALALEDGLQFLWTLLA